MLPHNMARIIFKGNGKYLVESFTNKGVFYEVDMKYGTDGICYYPHCKEIFCKHRKEVKSRLADNNKGIEGL